MAIKRRFDGTDIIFEFRYNNGEIQPGQEQKQIIEDLGIVIPEVGPSISETKIVELIKKNSLTEDTIRRVLIEELNKLKTTPSEKK
jgi:hypothetical protein